MSEVAVFFAAVGAFGAQPSIATVISASVERISTSLRLLALVFGERGPELRDRELLFFGGENDLAREDHRHRAGRRGEEVVERPAEAGLDVFDRLREVGADLGRALHAVDRDRMADEAAGLDEPRARTGPVLLLGGLLFRALRIGSRRSREERRRH